MAPDKHWPSTCKLRYVPLVDVVAGGDGYRVKSGESLESIAAAHGCSWRDIVMTNFGTEEIVGVRDYLRDQHGWEARRAMAFDAGSEFVEGDTLRLMLPPAPAPRPAAKRRFKLRARRFPKK